MLKDHIGKNTEAYIDEILIKSKSKVRLIEDIVEIFSMIRQYGLKLNLKKCSFRVEANKFLGFMVSYRGVEANPKKIKVIMDMKASITQKQFQHLTRRIVSLNRFFSASGEKAFQLY